MPAVFSRGIAARGAEARMEATIRLEGPVINFELPIPYYFQLSSYCEEKIKSKAWLPGQMLPSEGELCEKLGVSRTVIRQAIATLERKGLVIKQNGKRSMIAHPKYQGSLMQTLRGFFEDAIARGQRPSTKVLEAKVIPAPGEVAEALRIPAGEPVVLLDRLRALDGEPEVLVVTYLPERMCPGLLDEDLANKSLYSILEQRYGLRIVEGVRTITAIAADRRDASLLGVRRGSPLLQLRSVGCLEGGTPLEFYIAKHRGDRSVFEVKLVRDR